MQSGDVEEATSKVAKLKAEGCGYTAVTIVSLSEGAAEVPTSPTARSPYYFGHLFIG